MTQVLHRHRANRARTDADRAQAEHRAGPGAGAGPGRARSRQPSRGVRVSARRAGLATRATPVWSCTCPTPRACTTCTCCSAARAATCRRSSCSTRPPGRSWSPPAGWAADPVLDDEAKARYRRHLARLDEEIDRAAARDDDQKVAELDAERAALLDELRAAAGPGRPEPPPGRRGRTGPQDGDRANPRHAAQARRPAPGAGRPPARRRLHRHHLPLPAGRAAALAALTPPAPRDLALSVAASGGSATLSGQQVQDRGWSVERAVGWVSGGCTGTWSGCRRRPRNRRSTAAATSWLDGVRVAGSSPPGSRPPAA